jgi:hypothetical protein
MKLSTTLRHLDDISNEINKNLTREFYEYLKAANILQNQNSAMIRN